MRLQKLLLHQFLVFFLILLCDAQNDNNLVICNETSIIDSHPVDDIGECIFRENSPGCNGEYYLYIDESIDTVTLYIDGSGNADAKLYKNEILVEQRGNPPDVSSEVVAFQYDSLTTNGYGKYTVKVQSDGSLDCVVYARSVTQLGIDGGFVEDQQDDSVQEIIPQSNEGVGRMPIVNHTSYFAFQYPHSLIYPAKPQYLTFVLPNGTAQKSSIKDRYNCEASLISEAFQCDNFLQEEHFVKITGIDRKGNNWERVYPFYCEIQVAPPTSPPELPPTECWNGGELINIGEPNQECYCSKYYEGKICETQRCFNGGEIGRFGFCTCEAGYGGQFCEHVICEKQAEGYDDPNFRAIVFIVRRGRSMVKHIEEIHEAARMISDFYSINYPTYIQKWVLVTVFNGQIDTFETSTASEFQKQILAIKNEEDTICNDALFTAISTAIDHPAVQMYKRSLLFIFSDGMPNDRSADRIRLMHQLCFFRGQMFFMLADSPYQRCTIDTTTEEYKELQLLAQFSFGQVVYLQVYEIQYATYHLAVLSHKVDHIYSNDFMDSCKRAPKYQTFFVDRSLKNLFIAVTGKDLQLKLTNPAQESAAVRLRYSTSNRLYIWELEKLDYGSYLMELISGSYEPCSIRVFGMGNTSLWMGVASTINEDASVKQPVYKENSHIVARINNVNYADSENIIAEATIWTNEAANDKRTVLYASGGIYRDSCNFNLYFGFWKCAYPNKIFYVNVFLSTADSGVIQRSYPLFCSTIPPTEKPSENCLNGGIEVPFSNGTSMCICPAHYGGPKCEKLQCLNMGTPLDSRCGCISGFSGDFCEKPSCYQKNTADNFSPNQRSLTFIIQNSLSTRASITNIMNKMPTLVQDLTHQQKDWISNYQLWSFDDKAFKPLSSSSDPNVLMDAISKLEASNRKSSNFACKNLYVLPGLLRVLMNHELTLNGIVYLFINGYMKIDRTKKEVEAVYELFGRTRVMFNVVLMSGDPCGHDMSEDETTTLMNFVGYTGGQFIMVLPNKAGDVIRSIPTLYRTNYIYDSTIKDCTTTQNIYFPIDSQTQSFTAYLVGDFEDDSIVYYMPNGEVKKPYNIWTDYGMGSQMNQIIQECDDEWALVENRCWRFVVERMNWTDAQQTCRQNNAVLISLFNAQEQEFLNKMSHNYEHWIGLNNLQSEDEYTWDTLDDIPLKLKNTGYNHFGKGQPVADPGKRCVYNKADSGWANDDCSAERNFICVKHAYNAEYEPDVNSLEDLLARGIWKLSLKTLSGGCSVQIYGQSGIGLYTQYVTNIHMDSGSEQPYTYANDNRFISHVTNQVATSQGLSGSLQYAHFYKNSGQMNIIEAETFLHRDSNKCAFEYISTPFKCPENNFLALVTGIDRFGYLYQRIQPVNCLNEITSESCENGIYSNGRCLCDPSYRGDFCETPICEHGQLDIIQENCKCTENFAGTFCELPKCIGTGVQDIPSVNKRTFILLLDGSQNGKMENVASNLQSILKKVFDEIAKNQNWFSHYSGIVFRDESMGEKNLSKIIEADDPTKFIEDIMEEAKVEYKPEGQSRSTISALQRILESPYIVPRSYIWILTGGNAEHPENLPAVLDLVALTHSYVNFLILDDTTTPGGADATSDSVMAYYDLVTETSGQFYQVSQENADTIASFWAALLATYYDAYFITTVSEKDCSYGLEEYLQVDSNTSGLILDYSGVGELELSQPDGTVMELQQYLTNSNSKTNKVYKIPVQQETSGIWKVKMKEFTSKIKFCRLEVRDQSQIEAFVGYVHDTAENALHSNNVDYRPLADEPNSVVANTNLGKITFVQVYSADERNLLWSSPMIRRDGCVYQYISAATFTCKEKSLSISIDGIDENGFAFRRIIHTHCTGVLKTTVPTTAIITTATAAPPVSATCDKNGKYDIIIFFDSSESFNQNQFRQIVNQYSELSNVAVIDDDHSVISLGMYSTQAYSQGTCNNQNSYLETLELVEKYGYEGDVGNDIYSVFASIKEKTFRDNATKVLLLFSSLSLNNTDGTVESYENPVPLATEFLNKNGRVIALGYGGHADAVLLNDISKGCSRIATTFEQLQQLIQWSINAVCSAERVCPGS